MALSSQASANAPISAADRTKLPQSRSKRSRAILAVLAALMVVVLAGCVPGGGGNSSSSSDADKKKGPPKFDKGTTMAMIQQRGKLNVGVVNDAAPFSSLDPNQGTWVGLDVEVAKHIAESIFGSNIEGRIEWIPLQPSKREDTVVDKRVDIALGRYAITTGRKYFVDFAGPYYVATQDVIVRSRQSEQAATGVTSAPIQSLYQLNGRKVCVIPGSTNIDALAAAVPGSDRSVVQRTPAECMAKLADHSVDAVAGTHVDLIPALQSAGRSVELFSASYGAQPFGIGMAKGDTAFRTFLNDSLEKWENASTIYQQATQDQSSQKIKVDRY